MNEGDALPPEPWPYKPEDLHGWPEASDCDDAQDFKSELCKAKLEVRKKRTDAAIAHDRANEDAGIAVAQEYYKAVFEVAKGSIDRARASAETVQKSAAAIVTLYTGVLALAFSVGDNPLPAKALFAAILLGVAILLATAFIGFMPDPDRERERISAEGGRVALGERLTSMFVRWTRKAALERGKLLRGAVVALAGAVALMPAPFVTLGEKAAASEPISWPSPDPASGTDPELAKILYTAQVAEAADQRKEPLASGDSDELWTLAFGAALLATAAVLIFPRRGDSAPDGSKWRLRWPLVRRPPA